MQNFNYCYRTVFAISFFFSQNYHQIHKINFAVPLAVHKFTHFTYKLIVKILKMTNSNKQIKNFFYFMQSLHKFRNNYTMNYYLKKNNVNYQYLFN